MNRRTFVATLAGGGAVLVGTGAFLGDGTSDGPDYGSIAVPSGSGPVTLDNGRRATLFDDGAVAFFGAALVSQHSGIPAVVGRVKNVSGTTIAQVRVEVEFLDGAGEVLAGGWIGTNDFGKGRAWQFVANYPNSDADRIATAAVTGIDAS